MGIKVCPIKLDKEKEVNKCCLGLWDLGFAPPSSDSCTGSCDSALLGHLLEFTYDTLMLESRSKVTWVPQKEEDSNATDLGQQVIHTAWNFLWFLTPPIYHPEFLSFLITAL